MPSMGFEELPLELLDLVVESLDSSQLLLMRLLNSTFEHRLRKAFVDRLCKAAHVRLGNRTSLNRLHARSKGKFASYLLSITIELDFGQAELSADTLLDSLWNLRSGYSTLKLTSALVGFPNCKAIHLGSPDTWRPSFDLSRFGLESQEHSGNVVEEAIAAISFSGIELDQLAITSSSLGPVYPIALPDPDRNMFLRVKALSLTLEPLWNDECGTLILCSFLGRFAELEKLELCFTSWTDEWASSQILGAISTIRLSALKLTHLNFDPRALVNAMQCWRTSLHTIAFSDLNAEGGIRDWVAILDVFKRFSGLKRLTMRNCSATDGTFIHEFEGGSDVQLAILDDIVTRLTGEWVGIRDEILSELTP